MARLPRIDVPGVSQHVVGRGVDRQPCFFRTADYDKYLEIVQEAAVDCHCAIHAYVLMTNHVHLLVTGKRALAVSSMMKLVGGRYVRRINSLYGRTGTLFEGRFKASLVQTDRYLLTCMRYIELNPVRAGIVAAPDGYRWSSYPMNAGINRSGWLTPHDEYVKLGRSLTERWDIYRALFSEALGAADLDAIRLHVQKNCALGDNRFQAQVALMLERRVRVTPRGRPHGRSRAVPV
jgi:REP-associated tyrosine transposase